jgi:hypothetical protein
MVPSIPKRMVWRIKRLLENEWLLITFPSRLAVALLD